MTDDGLAGRENSDEAILTSADHARQGLWDAPKDRRPRAPRRISRWRRTIAHVHWCTGCACGGWTVTNSSSTNVGHSCSNRRSTDVRMCQLTS